MKNEESGTMEIYMEKFYKDLQYIFVYMYSWEHNSYISTTDVFSL